MPEQPTFSSTSTTTPTDLAPAVVDVAMSVVEALANQSCHDASEYRVYVKALAVLEQYFDAETNGEQA